MSSEEVLTVQCSNCGAALDYRQGDATAFCPFCNTITKLRDVKETKEHYSLAISVGRDQIRKLLVGDLLKVPGVPDTLQETLQIVEAKLVYEPYYIGQIHGNLKWAGLGRQARFWNYYKGGYRNISFYTEPESGVFDDHLMVTIYAGTARDPEITKYRFAAKGRRFFSASEIKADGGEIVEEQLDFKQAEEKALEVIVQKHQSLLAEELETVQQTEPEYHITQMQLIHVPMWHIKWKTSGSGKTYKAILDAASGATLLTDTPKSAGYWASMLGITAAFAAIAVSPFFVPLAMFKSGVVLFSITGISGALAIQTIWKNAKRSYRERRD